MRKSLVTLSLLSLLLVSGCATEHVTGAVNLTAQTAACTKYTTMLTQANEQIDGGLLDADEAATLKKALKESPERKICYGE